LDLFRKIGLNKGIKPINFISYIWGEFSQDRDKLCMVAEGTSENLFHKNESRNPTEEQRQLGCHAQRLQFPPFVELATT
jgi:hypothetical protein